MQNVGFAGVQGVPLDRTVAQASPWAAAAPWLLLQSCL